MASNHPEKYRPGCDCPRCRQRRASQRSYYHSVKGKKTRRAYDRQYRQRPEVKARAAAYNRTYWQKPEVRQKNNIRQSSPEFQAYRRAYYLATKTKKSGSTAGPK